MIDAPDADQDDLASYIRELDRVRGIVFARAQRRERDGMTYAAQMQAYYERLDLFHFGLCNVEPRRPRRGGPNR